MFRTYEPTRDRLVAVKVFRLDVTPEQAQSLADELARAAEAGLFHPSIVEPIAAGVEGTVAYRAEEYVAAESLDVAMRHYAPAPLDKALPFITQLAGAIDFARAAGVGQGALHPRDIFVTPDEARATGFGVVEALERVGLRAPVRRPYSAPERIAGEAWSTAADVFSLAAIAYELLTARRPSGTGEQVGSLDGSHAGTNAAGLHAVLARAMDDDPARRYSTALAFAAALEAAARGEHTTDADAAAPGSATSVPQPIAATPVAAMAPLAPPKPVRAEHAPPPEPLAAPPAAEPDDIALERDEDEALHALMREEDATESPALFDEDAKSVFHPVDTEPERFADDFARPEPPAATHGHEDSLGLLALDDEVRDAEPAAGEFASAEDSRSLAPVEEEVRENPRVAAAVTQTAPASPEMFGSTVVDERPRSAVLPYALMLVLGLLIGLAAGYAILGRDRDTPTASSTGPAQPQGGEAGARPPAPGEFTEQPLGRQPQAPARPPNAGATPQVRAETPAPPARKPEPKPAPAATRGKLVIQSTPAGAGVTVNGRWRGRTPLTIDDLRFGPYTIRVVQPGYAVAREEFTLSAGAPERTLSMRLRRSSAPPLPETSPAPASSAPSAVGVGSIYVDSRPRGARVFVDDKPVGTTPLRLGGVRYGPHTVRLELEDHRTWMATKDVLAGQETTFTGSLERIR